MKVTKHIHLILQHYEGETPGTKARLVQLLTHGALAGTGRLIILPVDQGFEHGPARSFEVNPAAYDPHYHFSLAIQAGVAAFAAPLGVLESGAETFAGQIPLILKMNSSNTLMPAKSIPNQAVTASVKDALRLGCNGIGFTIYPGSETTYSMLEEVRELIREAKSNGLTVTIWSYPRGQDLTKKGETALDVVAYGAHMAALMGAHIIKVKIPTAHIELSANQRAYSSIAKATVADRVRHIVRSCFEGRRIVVFSGGETKAFQDVINETYGIYEGGGHGSIIGRNSFQRPLQEALGLLKSLHDIYLGKKED